MNLRDFNASIPIKEQLLSRLEFSEIIVIIASIPIKEQLLSMNLKDFNFNFKRFNSYKGTIVIILAFLYRKGCR